MIEWQTGGASGALDEMRTALNAQVLAERAAQGFVAGTQQVAPVETGALRRSIRLNEVTGSEGEATATWGPHVIYGRIQDQGGIIRVRVKKVLANRATGQFFGKAVTIPGQHYMSRGADAGMETASANMLAALEESFGA